MMATRKKATRKPATSEAEPQSPPIEDQVGQQPPQEEFTSTIPPHPGGGTTSFPKGEDANIEAEREAHCKAIQVLLPDRARPQTTKAAADLLLPAFSPETFREFMRAAYWDQTMGDMDIIRAARLMKQLHQGGLLKS